MLFNANVHLQQRQLLICEKNKEGAPMKKIHFHSGRAATEEIFGALERELTEWDVTRQQIEGKFDYVGMKRKPQLQSPHN